MNELLNDSGFLRRDLFELANAFANQLHEKHISIPTESWNESTGPRLMKYDQQIVETIDDVENLNLDIKEKLLIMFYVGKFYGITTQYDDM